MRLYWDEELDQIQTDTNTYYYYHEDGEIHLDLKTLEGYQDEAYLGSICSSEDDEWRKKIEKFIKEFEYKEENISFTKRLNTETRKRNISIGKAGGNASVNAKTYKISIPSNWMTEMGIDEENREVRLSFDGEKIIIEKGQ